MESLQLTIAQIQEIRSEIARQIRRGLPRERERVKALPAFLPPPPACLQGRAWALDLGGTTLRAAVVRLGEDGEAEIEAGSRELRISSLTPGEDLFAWQATALEGLTKDELPLGYCFSYPARGLPDGDAVLLAWTKEIDFPEVVGKKVGALLKKAARGRKERISKVVVLNDTVAALLGGSWRWGKNREWSGFIGMVVGTGFNLSAFFPVSALGIKTAGWKHPDETMAVNLEAGNLHPPHLSPWDEKLDATREDAGRQRLEKAVSGKYLPELAMFILEGRTAPPFPALAEIDRWATESNSDKGILARILLERAGDLVAATLAGLGDVLATEGMIGVIAEGSVINKSTTYRRRVLKTLNGLTGAEPRPARLFSLLSLPDANLVGAAVAAML